MTNDARIMQTDSGGIQEDTSILRVPYVTLWGNTKQSVMIEVGTNRLIGTGAAHIPATSGEAVSEPRLSRAPPLQDSRDTVRIAAILTQKLRAEKLRRPDAA